ncbi:MAG: hypothetical protein ACLUNH_08835 [Hominenteromicrobium sp.]|uniref:hypothetical protein n=1 Tax=Hominenteromicrobium sp. TaxID=3073581 RepID=UPI003993B77D
MAYNKARAEKQWLKWKEAEEKKLRELGVDAHKLSTYIGSFYPYIITSKKRFVLFCHSGLFFVPIGKTPTEKALTRCVGLKVPNRLTVISAPSEKISFNLISYDGNRYL